jgi:cytoskeleton protein RodZ
MTDESQDVKPDLSKLLIAARESKGYSQQDVADKLMLSLEQIVKIEEKCASEEVLTTFERGYLRNYATLIELDLSGFDALLPENESVEAKVELVQRFHYETSKPFMSRGWVKTLIYILLVGLLAWLIYTFGFNVYENDFSQTMKSVPELTLPVPTP